METGNRFIASVYKLIPDLFKNQALREYQVIET